MKKILINININNNIIIWRVHLEFLIVCIIIGYLLYKNNSLKKSLSNLTQKINRLTIEQNNKSTLSQNYKSTEEKIESIKKSTYYYKEKILG